MDIFEMAAKLVEKTGVTFEEAKKALEENGGDMLDAVIALERAGKIQKKAAYYSSSDDQTEEEAEVLRGDVFNADGTKAKTSTTREQAGRFWESVKRFVKTLTSATFQVERKGEELIAVPVLVLILALIFGFHLMVVLLIGANAMSHKLTNSSLW